MGCTRKLNLAGRSYLTETKWDRIKFYLPEPEPQPKGVAATLESGLPERNSVCTFGRLPMETITEALLVVERLLAAFR